ncbi:MAG TPA: histidine--tRNA ligase [Pyrodictiaceae archaeon]|nr:histidine--tRNA ligase [Pyrodictiaceae archaeon]HIQ11047.1 histidine--tRNA ligase [Pyrodictium sp.]HIQ55500.1 histidine--tRNA ligase [Pyrodictium sp.]
MSRYKIALEPLRGFRDILEPSSRKLKRLAEIFSQIAEAHGYTLVIPPTLERFELFAVKSGEEIKQSMFVFKDKAGRQVALRPEITASATRIYLKHLQGHPKPIRIYYIANCFRYEEPQHARYREFWQAGLELIGVQGVVGDIEVIKIMLDFYEKIGMTKKIKIKLGNIALYRRLFNYYNINEQFQDHLLHLMDKGLHDKVLDELTERGYGQLTTKLKELWEIGFEKALEYFKDDNLIYPALEELKLIYNVIAEYNPQLSIEIRLDFARGLAYYTGPIFEVTVPGFPVSIAGGGRYDKLIEVYGGPPTPGTGFAIGLDRTLIAAEELGIELNLEERQPSKAAIVILAENSKAVLMALQAQRQLISAGCIATIYQTTKLSKFIPRLLDQNYRYLITIGNREVENNTISLKDLIKRKQVEANIEQLLDLIDCSPLITR